MIPFNDLRRQNDPIAGELNAAITKVIESGRFVLGEEVEAFEHEFAHYTGTSHCVGVASGTDALQITLMALGIEPGDEVITAANTCVPTISAIVSAGATPVLADVELDRLTIDPASVDRTITPKTRAVVPVHLYGHPCDIHAIQAVMAPTNAAVIEDCAQAHGARYLDQKCGTFGKAAAFSFYPTKNLGALGDGGAVVTNSPEIAERIRALGQYGRTGPYEYSAPGINSRLDELQAAVLRVKLRHLDDWNQSRIVLAHRYEDGIDNEHVQKISQAEWATPNHHLFVVRTPHRDALQQRLAKSGVSTQIHYAKPIHFLGAFQSLGRPGSFPISEQACGEVLSLPLYPGMPVDNIDAVIDEMNRFQP